MDFVYWWRSGGFWYATTDKVLADAVLHGGIQIFLKPVDKNAGSDKTLGF